MNKEEILNNLRINNSNGYKTRENVFSKVYPTEYSLIKSIDFTDNWYEKLYCFLFDIKNKPRCLCCENYVNFDRFTKGYYSYCSITCRNKDEKLKLIGEKNPMKDDINKKKIKKTKLEKYGNENYVNVDKIKKTKNDRYNDENYNNRIKAKKTNFDKYGNSKYTNRTKAKKTNLERYGDVYYNNPDKRHKTNFNKYGVKIYNNRDKAKNTCMLKYGVSSHTQSDDYKTSMFKKTIENWINKLNINDNDLNYDGDCFIISNYCKKHKTFKINKYVLRNRLNYGINDICTICNPISEHTSIKEKEISDFICDELGHKTKKIKINGKEVDIFLSDYNLGIEFNGLYWHSNIFVDKNYHINKTNICEENNIQLLHVFENEWVYKKEIIKSIIRNKLNIVKSKIHARKCEIRDLKTSEAKDFLNNNHIQGFVNSSVRLGLFYDNELVSIMTFGKSRIVTGGNPKNIGEYELLRYCSKLNTVVVGGASKLLKWFIKKHNPIKIITYSDRRYSMGNLYLKLGFMFIKNTTPNYWYFKSGDLILHHRFKFRKNVLIDKYGYSPDKTESQIMAELNYYKIYDSGHKKFELILE